RLTYSAATRSAAMRRSSRRLSLFVWEALQRSETPTRITGTISSCSKSHSVLDGCTCPFGDVFQRRSPTPVQSRQLIESAHLPSGLQPSVDTRRLNRAM